MIKRRKRFRIYRPFVTLVPLWSLKKLNLSRSGMNVFGSVRYNLLFRLRNLSEINVELPAQLDTE